MPIGDLSRLGADAFVAAGRSRMDAPWLFIHLPKTAGSSLQNQFAGQRGPFYNIYVDYLAPFADYNDALDEAVDAFIHASRERRFGFVSGHIDMQMANRILAEGGPMHLCTMLRRPVERVISEYRYQRTPAHPPHVEFRRRHPTLAGYMRRPEMQNIMFKQLALEGEDVAELIERMDRTFDFVGTLETYEASLRILGGLSGVNLRSGVVIRRTEGDGDDVEETPELQAEIARLNARDMALWRHYNDRLAGIAAKGR